jgi:hypothetical protein
VKIGGGGSENVNIQQSDDVTRRNLDSVAADNQAFWGGAQLSGASAKYPHVQIYNPSGSGVILLLDSILISPVTESTYGWGLYNTECTTDVGAVQSKLVGGAAGNAHVRTENNSSVLVTGFGPIYVGSGRCYELMAGPPFIIGAAEGIAVYGVVANTAVGVAFNIRELTA